MGEGSPLPTPSPVSLSSSPSGYSFRPTERSRDLTSINKPWVRCNGKCGGHRHFRGSLQHLIPKLSSTGAALCPHISMSPSSTPRFLITRMGCGRPSLFSVSIKTFCLREHALSRRTVSFPTKVVLFRLFGQMTLTQYATFLCC